MFIQVISGKVSDPGGLERAFDHWQRDLRPGATGFLGSTGGVTADGRFIMLVRFESADAAQANSDRPEQGTWWAEAEKCFDGPVGFLNCTDVDLYRGGGSDDAEFIQVMQGHADRARLQDFDRRAEDVLPDLRPDLLGGIRAWQGDEYVEAAYFTNEADARAGESKEPPPDFLPLLEEWREAMGEVTYFDLTSPYMMS